MRLIPLSTRQSFAVSCCTPPRDFVERDAILHDERDATQRSDVRDRIAVDGDDIRALPRLERACLPLDAAGLGAPARPGEQRILRPHAESYERLELIPHETVHAVSTDSEPDAGAQDERKAIVHDLTRPADLLHDRRALRVALLDARRMEEHREGADEPGLPVDHARDVLVR